MAVKIIGLIIGILVLGAGLYYLSKEKHDPKAKKIYTVISIVGGLALPSARRCCFSERALPKGRKAKRRDFGHAAFSNAKGFLVRGRGASGDNRGIFACCRPSSWPGSADIRQNPDKNSRSQSMGSAFESLLFC